MRHVSHERASALIAVSDFTRREVVELLGVSEDQIHVVPNGVGPLSRSRDRPLRANTCSRSRRSSRGRTSHAWCGRSSSPGCPAASCAWWARGVGADVELTGSNTRWLGEVTDEELAALYRGALCVAYVSLYEGFGLPVLEAMACGTPVVTSTAEALRELGGDAVVTVDPLDPEAIAHGLEEAIRRRDELRARGLERASAFSWQRTAEATAAVYQAVAA